MSKEKVKLCVNCTWCLRNTNDYEKSICCNPKFIEYSQITGEVMPPHLCSTMRVCECGSSARFFESSSHTEPTTDESECLNSKEEIKKVIDKAIAWLRQRV